MVSLRIPMIGGNFKDVEFDRNEMERVLEDPDILSVQWWLNIQQRSPDEFCILVFWVLSLRNNFKTGIPSVTYNMALVRSPVFTKYLLMILPVLYSKVPSGEVKTLMNWVR